MESHLKVSTMLTKFSVLCEILPFIGHYYYWKYILCNVSKKTRQTWLSYEEAFMNLPDETKFKVVSYLKTFDEDFKDYLSDQ